MSVDKKVALPTRIEAYAASGLLVKTLYFKDIKDFGGGIRRPATRRDRQPAAQGLQVGDALLAVKKRAVPDEVFTWTTSRAWRNCASEARRRGRALLLVAATAPPGWQRRPSTPSTPPSSQKKPFEFGGYAEFKQEALAFARTRRCSA